MKKWLAYALAVATGALLLVGARRPAAFHVERSVHVDASAEAAYAIVSDLSRFDEWQPWRKYDLVMPARVVGAPGEVGATYTWSGNVDVGSGVLTLTRVVPGERVEAEVRARAPWQGTCRLTWQLRADGSHSVVTFRVDGIQEGVLSRVSTLFLDRDTMVGRDLNEGLWRLKHVAERR